MPATYASAAVPSTAAAPQHAQRHTVRSRERKLAGLSFLTFDALIRTAFRRGRVANEGERLDAAQSARLRAACRAVWEAARVPADGRRAF